ncbi:Mif2/CENP-C like-domain-containing protein [Scleroderma yunnanense]
MPREPRKSSLGTRRGPPRQHIPFRADDLARGKKTGIAVQYVDRNSDEFEPFAEVMKQADNRTPPRIKSKKRRSSFVNPVRDDVDEDGEMSMDLAESNQGSPLAYFTNANPAYVQNNARRVSSFRPAPRTSLVDYDQVPSPRHRPSALSARIQMANGAGPSSHAKSLIEPDPLDDFDPPQLDDADYGQENHPDEDEEGEVEEEMEVVSLPKKSDKGKRRADPEDQDQQDEMNDVEEDIVRGLEDAENGGEEEEEEVAPSKNKVREEKPKKLRGRPAKRVLPAPERSPTPEGVRRGRRHRYKPLEWWRQEKVVYGRRESGLTLVPQIKEIIRIPKEPPTLLGKAGKRKRGSSVRAKSKIREVASPINPEEGWDDNTPAEGIVLDFLTQEPVRRRVIQTAKMFEPKSAANSNWFFQKIFGEGDFIAAGEMVIPPEGKKPSKSSKDNAYVFYVIEGAVSVVIHETTYVVATGGMFLVPRGNTYYVHNICERDARLFFTQARHVAVDNNAAEHNSHSAPPPASHRRRLSEIVDDRAPTSAALRRSKSRH